MKTNKRFLLIIFTYITCITLNYYAEDEVYEFEDLLISAARNPISPTQTGSAVTVITRADIERHQTWIVSDILRTVPGVSVSRSGVPGSLTQVRIRGAEANHTLVIIDGIEMNDPFLTEFNFAHLLSADIERIEVIRGPQSALYGSDAIGGVINITTKSGKRSPNLSIGGSVEVGSFNTGSVDGNISKSSEWYHFSLSGSRYQTEGINIARRGDEKDGYKNMTLGITAGLTPIENLTLDISLRYTDTSSQFDNGNVPVADDDQEKSEVNQFYGRIQGSVMLLDKRWKHTIGAAITDTNSDFFGMFPGENKGQRLKYDYQTTYILDATEFADSIHRFTFAYEREELGLEKIGATSTAPENQEQDIDQNSFIGEYQIDLFNHLSLTSSIRYDDNERFKDEETYRFAGAYRLSDFGIKIHGSYGTGISNPSLTELFGFFPGSFKGNSNLKPEKSAGFDVGVEKKFKDGSVVVDVTYFNATLKDEIVSDSTFTSVLNAKGKSDRQGIEVSAKAQVTDSLGVSGSYTYTDAEDPNGEEETRRAKHIASTSIYYQFLDDRATINLGVDYNGKQNDKDFSFFPSRTITLEDYLLVNVSTTYQVAENAQWFARVENLLDENYEEVFSYSTTPIAYFTGIRMNF